MAHRGLGVSRLQGRVVFLFAAAPGEEVTARVTKVRRHYAFADTVEVHRASPERVEPPCPYFGRCGGCQLQHLSYGAQLEAKRSVLLEALAGAGLGRLPEPELAPAADPWRYRWRGEFHLGPAAGSLGFTARAGYQVVPIEDCLIHQRALTAELGRLGEAAGQLRPRPQTLLLTLGQGGEQLLVQARPRPEAGQALVSAAQAAGAGLQLTDESTQLSYRGRQFRVFPEAFVQVNQGTLAALYEPVVEWLRPELPGESVIDAYGGLGVLSLRLAEEGARVTVIESNPVSARLCRLHADMHGFPELEVVCAPVEEELPRQGPARAVVLDPPRAGLAPQVSGWLGLAGPPTLAYLSCEVSALARDLRTLCRLGPYRLERLRLVDMFPQTYHFETVCLLRRS